MSETVELGHGLTLVPRDDAISHVYPFTLEAGGLRISVRQPMADALIAACGADWVCELGDDRTECERREHADKGLLCGHRRDIVDIPPAVCGAAGDGLPEGVHAAPDGTLLWKCPSGGAPRPEGYTVHDTADGTRQHPQYALNRGRWYEVRPVPAPVPVQVPWHRAITERRNAPDGRLIATGGQWASGKFWVGNVDGTFIAEADPDGTVACLPLPEENGARLTPSGDGTVTQ